MPQTLIDIAAFIKLGECFLGCLQVSVDFPWPGELAVLSTEADKALHILQRIAQKYANLVGEILCTTDATTQSGNGAIQVSSGVAIKSQKLGNLRTAQGIGQLSTTIPIDLCTTQPNL